MNTDALTECLAVGTVDADDTDSPVGTNFDFGTEEKSNVTLGTDECFEASTVVPEVNLVFETDTKLELGSGGDTREASVTERT